MGFLLTGRDKLEDRLVVMFGNSWKRYSGSAFRRWSPPVSVSNVVKCDIPHPLHSTRETRCVRAQSWESGARGWYRVSPRRFIEVVLLVNCS